MLKLALSAPDRLLELTAAINHLPEKEFHALAAHLAGLDLKLMPDGERIGLWSCLHELIRRHEFFTTADWHMGNARLGVLKSVEVHLRPKAPAERGRWLFAEHHLYIGTYGKTSLEAQEALALVERKKLLTEIFANGGVAAIAKFAAALPFPGLVGNVFAQTQLCPNPLQVLPAYLDRTNPNTAVFGRGYAHTIFGQRGWEWVDSLPLGSWTIPDVTEFLFVLPFTPRTWGLAQSLGTEAETAYWSRVQPFPRGLNSAQATHALKRLLSHNRPLVAVDYLGLVYHNRLSVPAALLSETLEKCVPELNNAATSHDVAHLIHELEELLGHLQDAPDCDPVSVAQLEWTYLPLMRHGNARPKFLHRELGRDPAFFANCVELIWRKDASEDPPTDKTEEMVAKAKLAYDLLETWPTHPSLLTEGGPDEAALLAWINEARRLCAASGHVKSCDHEIGKLLSSSPKEVDGSWPCIAVRNALESIPGEIALDSFHTGIFNSQGGSSRGIHDGGERERALAKEYHAYADACQMRWPRVSATLRKLARVHEADAGRMDEQADDHA